MYRVPCITTMSGARAAAEAVAARLRDPIRVWSLQEIHEAKTENDYARKFTTTRFSILGSDFPRKKQALKKQPGGCLNPPGRVVSI